METGDDDIDNNELTVDEEEKTYKRCRLLRSHQTVQSKRVCAKEERNASIKKVSVILQKAEDDRSFEETEVLRECPDAVEEVQERWRKRDAAKKRLEEIEDPIDVLTEKCQILAQAIAQSQHLVMYTGAGISTAAKIPDYRGSNGIWTRLQQGKEIGDHDLSLAEPTYTHMALSELYRQNILKYVVSQNCDGLHLRSGLPRLALSELHGNMYIEVCKNCKPHKEYWRSFDVTENTARYAHNTNRRCYICNFPLIDTIVHFGERGSLHWPLNWTGACKNAKLATTIICLGSSLKVLKKYPWLWQMDKPAKRRPNLYIVNLQWTPKDDFANVKIHGKCDHVMEIVMKMLGIQVPPYQKYRDPIYAHSTFLHELEMHTTTQPLLKLSQEEISIDVKEEIKEEDKSSIGEFNNQFGIKDCSSSSNTFSDLSGASLNKFSSQICDKHSNRNNSSSSARQSLPEPKLNNVSPTSNLFLIDNLLQTNSVQQKYSLPQDNTPTYLSNNLFSPGFSLLGYNLLHHQFFNGYSDFFVYPYQTSFLYPGLHNIINPIPCFQEDLNDSQIRVKEETIKKSEPSCLFCDKNYNSDLCLFYLKTEPIFKNEQFRYSKLEKKEKLNACVCCDYSTDEEDIEDLSNDKDISANDNPLRNRIQAGWFGKGYKKCRRSKKRSSV